MFDANSEMRSPVSDGMRYAPKLSTCSLQFQWSEDQLKNYSATPEATGIASGAGCSIQVTLIIEYQAPPWVASIHSSGETVQHSLAPSRSYFKDRAIAVSTAKFGRAVEIALRISNQTGDGVVAVAAGETVEHRFPARLSHLENRTVSLAATHGCSVKIAFGIAEQTRSRKGAVALPGETVEHRLRAVWSYLEYRAFT
jgi:hypothetical protein